MLLIGAFAVETRLAVAIIAAASDFSLAAPAALGGC